MHKISLSLQGCIIDNLKEKFYLLHSNTLTYKIRQKSKFLEIFYENEEYL